MDYYVKIDEAAYLKNGEVKMIGSPKSWIEITSDAYNTRTKGAFHIHRGEALYSFIEAIAGKKGKVATYILRNKDPRNICMLRVEDVAKGAKVSLQTALDTLKALRASNSIKSISGSFMVNPGVDFVGDKQKERYLMKLYETFSERSRRTIAEYEEEEETT